MNNKGKKPKFKPGAMYIFIIVGVILLTWAYEGIIAKAQESSQAISFSEFITDLEEGKVKEIKVDYSGYKYTGVLDNGDKFICTVPSDIEMMEITRMYLIPQAADGLKITSQKRSAFSSILSWIPTIIMVVLLFVMLKMFVGGGAGGGKGMMNFGKSNARMSKGEENGKVVKFKDVAGLDEEKAELQEIVDFLKNPKKYTDLGARIPKGVLLVGPPGTGKTYISKAVAGEAGVPFFSISGSDFVEMFVGVGASRVRDLFSDAKKNAPCIVFIDEIDAVGRRRGAGIGGGNDEREQTLNQLLVEMDGFGTNEGIIILAATNRPDVLDPAILRPGRFDRQVVISTPDIKGREEVFKVHSKDKPLGKDIDLKVLAKRTPGFTPADIENMMNEAALLTARRNGAAIHMADIEEAITRVIAGPKKKSKVMSEAEKKLTAFHEAGHAVVMRSIPGSDPVHQITIMPRGMAGGFTLQLPEEDKYYATKTDMLNEICHLLGGRVAEAVVLGDISTGASNDLERATKMAHDMVVKYGMTESVGPINYSDAEEVFLGRDFTSKQNFSEELAAKIDKEVRIILDSCYEKTEKILREHTEELNRVADALLEMETVDADEFEALYTNSKTLEEIKAESEEQNAAREAAEKKEAAAKARREAKARKAAEEAAKAHIEDGKRLVFKDKDGKVMILDAEAARKKIEDSFQKEEKAAEKHETKDVPEDDDQEK